MDCRMGMKDYILWPNKRVKRESKKDLSVNMKDSLENTMVKSESNLESLLDYNLERMENMKDSEESMMEK